jgi:hypothetical protein
MTSTPQSHLHTANVCATEADVRRASPLAHQREFAKTLERWAANQRDRASALAQLAQRDLFA